MFIKDIISILKRHELWFFMSWLDILLRYRRTVLGPFWLVIAVFVSIICTAVLGSLLFRVALSDFFPYVACGMVIWSYLSVIISESCTLYVAQSGLIKNINVPIISFAIRSFFKNTIVFFHNLVIIFLVLLYFNVPIGFSMILIFPGIILFGLNAIAIGIYLGFTATRLRDLTQAVNSLLGILAFVTPIMWKPEMLGSKAWLAYLNPMAHFVDILRDPLLGNVPSVESLTVVVAMTLTNLMIAALVYNRFHTRLVYWL